ncbi:hypothetical protein AN1V17_11500 [Vallitalea sediminicola]
MKNSERLLEYECVNCGFKAWSLREVTKCKKCGAIVVCTRPEETQEDKKEEAGHELLR